ASFGARLRVEPARGQMLALTHVPPVLTHTVRTDDVYLVPRPSGELLIGATVERVGFQRTVTAEGISSLLAAAIGLVPSLGSLPIVRTWYGFRPWAPDGLPIMGPWPDVEGLWVATAHFRNGILLAPITAHPLSGATLRATSPSPPSTEVSGLLISCAAARASSVTARSCAASRRAASAARLATTSPNRRATRPMPTRSTTSTGSQTGPNIAAPRSPSARNDAHVTANTATASAIE